MRNILLNFKEKNKFLISASFKEERKEFLDKNNFVLDNPTTQTSLIYLNEKETFDLNKLKQVFTLILSSKEREYQINASSFVSSKVTEENVVKMFIYVNDEINGDKFSLKTDKEEIKKHSIFTNQNIDKFCDDILISSQLNKVRKLQDTPSNILTIEKMNQIINELCASNKKLKLNVLEKDQIKNLGMNLIIGVNSGSSQDAKVVVIEYNGNPISKEKTTLVGKGIIFDTGGYNLKTGKHMLDMKFDMSGAAIAFYTIDTISKLNLKTNFSVVVPLTDNAVDSMAQVPETILTSMSGKTVEVANTDAEGRLILADAITYAAKELNSTLIIDIATLTGTVVYALGKYTGVWSTCDKNWEMINQASKNVNELIWRMPLDDYYIENLSKETFADTLSCSHTEYPDSNIAAAWLNQFAMKKDYIHLDIAGSADYKSKGQSPMLKTIVEFMKLKGEK